MAKYTTGFRQNLLVLIERVNSRKAKFQCDCGNTKIIDIRDVIRGKTKGCGCGINNEAQRAAASIRVKKLRELNIFIPKTTRKETAISKFLPLIRKTKNRKEILNTLTAADLQDVLDNQDGKCIYSDVDLIFLTSSQHNRKIKIEPYYQASVDRIDSSKGYTKDNVQLVSVACNRAKNIMSDVEMVKFISIIKDPTQFFYEVNDLIVEFNSNLTEKQKFGLVFKTLSNSNRKHENLLSINDINEVWEKQNGKCAYTYIPLVLKSFKMQNDLIRLPFYYQASIDRINSELPYSKDNIQFVSVTMNYAKNSMPDTSIKTFLNLIRQKSNI